MKFSRESSLGISQVFIYNKLFYSVSKNTVGGHSFRSSLLKMILTCCQLKKKQP